MAIYRVFVVFAVLLIAFEECLCGVTEEQMLKAGKLMRDVCQPKFKLSDDVADAIKEGKIPNDQNGKCYINCIMEMMQVMKKGKFNYEVAIKQIDVMMPDNLKGSFKNGMGNCKNAADGIKNNCEAAFTLLNCLRDNIPEFTFP